MNISTLPTPRVQNDSESACTFKSYAKNIGAGFLTGIGAGAFPCVSTTGGYLACVGVAGLGGAASGAFQSGVECTVENLSRTITN